MKDLEKLAKTLPYPVAVAYGTALNSQEDPGRRLWAAHFTVLQALKLTTLPVVTQYLHDPRPAEEMDPKAVEALNRAIAGIRHPYFQDWITLLGTLAKHIPALNIQPVFPLPELIRRLQDHRVQPFSREFAALGQERLNALEAFRDLRNGLAHGGMLPSPEQCLQMLDHYLPILEDLLAAFAFLGDGEWLALAQSNPPGPLDSAVRLQRLAGAALPEPEEIPLDDLLRQALEASPLVLRVAGQVLPLYPLFYQTATEPCAHYDGHFALRATGKGGASAEEKFILYLGMQSRLRESEPFEHLQELLERRRIQWWLTKEQTAPWTLYDSVRHYAWQTLEDLRGQKYFPQTYLERPEVMKHFGRFLEGGQSGWMLLGEAGSGKTAWCTYVVERLLYEGLEGGNREADLERRGQNLVFFIRGDALDLSEGRTLFQNLAERMGLLVQGVRLGRGVAQAKAKGDAGFASFAELLAHLDRRWKDDQIRQDRRLIFVLDALNECRQPERALRETLELVRTAARYPWCKVIFTVRWEYLNLLRDVKREGTTAPDPFYEVRPYLYEPEQPERHRRPGEAPPPAVVLERFTEEEAAQVYRRYQETQAVGPACTTLWEALPEETRRILTNPILLHLFMKAHGGRPASRIAGETAVFRVYLDELKRRFPQTWEAAGQVIGHMLKAGRAVLDDDDAHAIRRAWAEGKTFEEQQRLMAPLELLEYLGLVRKRVRLEGGGYVFLFQKVLEQLLYQFLRGDEGTTEPTEAYWLKRAKEPAPFPEYGNAFAFLFRELQEGGNYQLAARLVEAGQAYVGRALETFLKELAEEAWTPGAAGAGFERYVEGLAGYGQEWSAGVLFNVGLALAPTRYAPAAEAAGRACLRIQETLHRDHPEHVEIAHRLGTVLTNLGALLQARGAVGEAEGCYRRAVEILEALHRDHPEHVEIANALATVLMNLGVLLRARGAVGQAEGCYRRAVEILEVLHRDHPEHVEIADGLVRVLNNLGNLLDDRGAVGEAEGCYRRAVGIWEALHRDQPEHVEIANGLATVLTNLGLLLRARGAAEEAEGCYRRAVEILEALHRAHPEHVEIAEGLAMVLTNLGNSLQVRGAVGEAEGCYWRAAEILEILHRDHPEQVEIANGLAKVLVNLGVLLRARGAIGEAEGCYLRAVEIREALHRAHPEHVEIADGLATVLTNLGVLLRARGAVGEAEGCYRRAIEIREALHRDHPEHVEIADGLARALMNLGMLVESRGDTDEALRCYGRGIQLFAAVVRVGQVARIPDWVKALGCRFYLWVRQKRWQEAAADLRQALEATEAYLATGAPPEPVLQEFDEFLGQLSQLDKASRIQLWAALGDAFPRLAKFLGV